MHHHFERADHVAGLEDDVVILLLQLIRRYLLMVRTVALSLFMCVIGILGQELIDAAISDDDGGLLLHVVYLFGQFIDGVLASTLTHPLKHLLKFITLFCLKLF